MLKPYKVQAYSELMNAEMNCVSLDQAFEIYEKMMNSPHYHSGDLSDNETGELYAYFTKRVDGNGIMIETWIAV